MGGVSVAGFRPGFGRGGMTHSLLVILSCVPGAGDIVEPMFILFAGTDMLTWEDRADDTGRMATAGVVEVEDDTEPGVSGPPGGDEADAAGEGAALAEDEPLGLAARAGAVVYCGNPSTAGDAAISWISLPQ